MMGHQRKKQQYNKVQCNDLYDEGSDTQLPITEYMRLVDQSSMGLYHLQLLAKSADCDPQGAVVLRFHTE